MSTLTSALAIGYLNRAAARPITASSENASYPDSNLANALLTSTWRSVAGVLTSVTVDADLGSSVDIDVMALLGFNGNDSATRTPALSDNSNFSSPEFAPGSGNAFDVTHAAILDDTPLHGRPLIVLPGQTYNSRYARFTLNNSGLAANYLKASVYWCGPLWQPPQSFDITSEPTLTYIGIPGAQKVLNGWRFVIKNLTEAQSRGLLSILRVKLQSGRYLIIPHPLDSKTWLHEAIYGTLIGDVRRVMMPSAPIVWQIEMEFREVED